ncbi:hypothetical protein [Flavobacterium sp.]|uniref:hypothetical protein n=1 Tax=Flavobacterium sp. TaxID=239 RepID=UPI0031CF7254
MKTNLKNSIPFAAAAVLGISGAFLTTSMQSAPSKTAPRTGYISVNAPCDTAVKQCSDNDEAICTANGQQLHGDNFNCSETLYQPLN